LTANGASISLVTEAEGHEAGAEVRLGELPGAEAVSMRGERLSGRALPKLRD
jgi:hypothetical protein